MGTPSHLIDEPERKKLAGVDSSYLNVAVRYSNSNFDKAMESLKCHKSQVSPDMVKWKEESNKKSKSTKYLREFVAPSEKKESLFD